MEDKQNTNDEKIVANEQVETTYKVETKGVSQKTLIFTVIGIVILLLSILVLFFVIFNQNNTPSNYVANVVVSSSNSSVESDSSLSSSSLNSNESNSTVSNNSQNKAYYVYATNEGKYIRFKYPEGWKINVQTETKSNQYFPKGVTSIEIQGDDKFIKNELPGGFGGVPKYIFTPDFKQVVYETRGDVTEELISSVTTKFKETPSAYKITDSLYLIVLNKADNTLPERIFLATKIYNGYESSNLTGIIDSNLNIGTILSDSKYFSNGIASNEGGGDYPPKYYSVLTVKKVNPDNKTEVNKLVEVLVTFLNSIEKKANVE